MRERIVTSLVAIPLALAVVAWPGGVPATVAWTVLLVLAMAEYCQMCRSADIPCRLWWGTAAIVLAVIAAQGRSPIPLWYEPVVLLAGWLAVVVETGRPDRRPVAAIGSTALAALWLAGLGSLLVRLRFWNPERGFSWLGIEPGAWMVIGLLLIVWALDSAAYFGGRLIGRRPLAPAISPKKTIEGSACGFAAAALAGLITAPLTSQTLLHGLMLGIIVGVAGQVGDLFESAVKRELRVKDSGVGLPGHGGWLDRIDSLLFASAMAAWWVMKIG